MLSGCRRLRRLRLALAIGALTAFPGAMLAASSAGEPAPRSTATARLTVVVPDIAVRREIARHCRDEARLGYVPIVRVEAGRLDVPPEGRFVRCHSGDSVFLVPSPG